MKKGEGNRLLLFFVKNYQPHVTLRRTPRKLSSLKKHFQKVVVIVGKILIALAAKKLDLPQNLRLVSFLGKAPICILEIPGGQDNPVGDFKEIGIVAAVRATNARPAFLRKLAGWKYFGFHCLPRQKKRGCPLG
jgi:hypothetical protein